MRGLLFASLFASSQAFAAACPSYDADLGNAIGQRNLPHGLELLNTLLFQGQNAIGILLGAIVPRVRSLLLIKDLGSRYKLNRNSYGSFCNSLEAIPTAATAHLPRKKEGTGFNAFPLFLALDEVGRYTLPELHHAFAACLDANQKLVTTQLDNQIVLERLLVGMLSTQKKAQRTPR
jgi:DNA polymerase-3 subunit delta